MKCSNCNNEISSDSKICPICGTIFASYFETPKLTKRQNIKLFLHRIFFGTILSIIVILPLIAYLIKYNQKMNILENINNMNVDTNEIYVSDERYYEYILNKKEKEIYKIILEGIKNYDENIVINLDNYNIDSKKFTIDTLNNIKHVLSMDHPELINLGSINVYDKEENNIKLIVNYTVSKDKYAENVDKIKGILEKLKFDTKDLNDYEKVKYVYTYFYENTSYTPQLDTKYYSAYGCFLLGACNNYGYAKAVQIVLSNLNINCLLATGSLNMKYHEWNIVKIDDKYYYYDQTKDTGTEITYNGFLFKDDNYKLYHKNMMPSKIYSRVGEV